MNRRQFLYFTAGGASIPALGTDTVAAKDELSVENLWLPRRFYQDDFELILDRLFDCGCGLIERLNNPEESEEVILTGVSENVVDAGTPLISIYDTSSPDALEKSVNYGPNLSSTDVELIFSVLEEVEEGFYMEKIPEQHILTASNRAFLLKSLVAATLNFYVACEDIVESDELTDDLRWNFYYSLFILLVEVILAKYPFDYRIAWRGTRFIHNQFLVRFRSILNDRGIAVIMKFIHWAGIRRQVSTDFAEWSFDSVLEFILEEGQGVAIYEEVESLLNEFEEDYTLDRWESYGEETKIELEQNPTEFIIDELLTPLAEYMEDVSIDDRSDLLEVIEDYSDLEALKSEIDLDNVSQDVLDTLEEYSPDEE